MSSASKIEWTEATWNPIVGCSILTPGCTNCYAMKMAARIEAMSSGLGQRTHYEGTTKKVKGKAVWTGKLAQAPEHILSEPLRRKKPTMYFVNSMSDLFHEDVSVEWIDRVFAVMALCPQHTFQVLTKRSSRMRAYLHGHGEEPPTRRETAILAAMVGISRARGGSGSYPVLPLSNVWLGVSAERQQEADHRIPDLIETPAAVKFISAEPLLGPIDFSKVPGFNRVNLSLWNWWVIVGGESGPGARPMHPDWARSIRNQCQNARVSFFFKQWGAWAPYDRGRVDSASLATPKSLDEPMQLFGKKLAGRLLDGREWNEMPVTKERVAA